MESPDRQIARPLARIPLAIVVAALFIACGDAKPQVTTSPSVTTAIGVEVVGPGTLAPGQSAQYVANLRLADGTIKAVTTAPDVIWQGYENTVFRLDASGRATGLGPGSTNLIALVHGPSGVLTGAKEIIVVPEGTYRMKGTITDADSPGQIVVDAQVSVTPGPAAITTDRFGMYLFYGVPQDATVRVTRTGYDPFERSLRLTAHTVQDFAISASNRLSLGGAYTVEMNTMGPCSDAEGPTADRPDFQRVRYDAILVQTGVTVEVVLTEPRFRVDGAGRGNRFTGLVDGTGATFTLSSNFAGPSIVERLPDGTFRMPAGVFVTTGSAAGLSGISELSGITQLDSTFPARYTVLGGCAGPSRLTLTPR